MTTPMMRGGTSLRAALAAFFQTALPPLIDHARIVWGLDEYQLPYPKKYDAIDPMAVANNEYPALGAVLINDRGHNRDDWDTHAQQVYSPVYSVRLFVIARTPLLEDESWQEPQKDSAIRLRDDLTSLVQQVLLQTPGLGDAKLYRVEEDSMTTDYLEPYMANTQSKRWIAASLMNIEIQFTETTWCPPIASADTFEVTTQLMEEG